MIEKLKELEQEAMDHLTPEEYETISEDTKHGISPNHEIQVIINGHRYNLS